MIKLDTKVRERNYTDNNNLNGNLCTKKNIFLQNYILKQSRSDIIICAPRNTVINGCNMWRAASDADKSKHASFLHVYKQIAIVKHGHFLFLTCPYALSIGKFLSFKNAFRGESKWFEN